MSIFTLATTLCSMIAIAAAISINGIEQSCSYQKAYGLAVKVLLVYGSHALTVKPKPGSGLLDTVIDVLSALLCPGYASSRAFIDLCLGFNATGIKGCVDTEAACLRIDEKNLLKTMRRARGKINARPVGAGEVFVIIPSGKHRYFRDSGLPLFNRRNPIKALIATVQLMFGIFQLAAASRVSIDKYGYGSYVFTIIPYAYASLVNGLASAFTAQYLEMQELLLNEAQGATLSDIFTEDAYKEGDWFEFLHILINIVVYLTIVRASTRFHERASTRAQRGWFLSWVIVGSFIGTYLSGGNWGVEDKSYFWPDIMGIMAVGAPSLGGFVALSQQYMGNFTCTFES